MLSLRYLFAAVAIAAPLAACSGTHDETEIDNGSDSLKSPLPPSPGCGGGKCDAKGACRPALGMPNYLCPDGKTIAGPTGKCLEDKSGACGWEVIKCPTTPPKCDCGPLPAIAKVCPDGSVAPPPKCVDVDPKSASPVACKWEWPGCPVPPPPPPPKCDAPGACGPGLGMPNYLCPDGKTWAGPGKCIDQGGKCGWEIITCPK
jgi:hypothetical protein